jgi:two-component system, response regulator PdtaR
MPSQRNQPVEGDMMPTRILLVDNDAIERIDVKERLTKQGYLVVGEAGDGRTALNLARQIRPDLVLMDIHLIDGDSIAIAEILMQEKVAPVVMLTELADPPLVERANVAGVVNYLIKPLRESEIIPAIEVTLARYQALRTLEEQVASLTEQLETRKIIERAKGLLIERGLTEQEAFRKIRKVSMDSRKSMREVAEAILLANDM